MKEIVGYLVFQTEIIDGFTLWHGFRLVADEQPVASKRLFSHSKKKINFLFARLIE